MEDCNECRVPLGFRSFADPLRPALWQSYQDSVLTEESDILTGNSSLIRDAFSEKVKPSGFAQLPLQTADLKIRYNEPYLNLEMSALRHRQQQTNCLAVGISNAIRGAAIGSVFGGAMGKLLHIYLFSVLLPKFARKL